MKLKGLLKFTEALREGKGVVRFGRGRGQRPPGASLRLGGGGRVAVVEEKKEKDSV